MSGEGKSGEKKAAGAPLDLLSRLYAPSNHMPVGALGGGPKPVV